MKSVYAVLIQNKQKAIVAFILATVGSFVAQHGFTLDMTLKDALEALLFGVLGHQGIFWTKNK